MNRVSHSTACHGISLIETLLALVLSSIISILVVQSFSQSKFLYLDGESRARAQENGRYAMQLLTKAIRSADYWGCIPSLEADTEGKVSWPSHAVLNNVHGLAQLEGIKGREGDHTATPSFPHHPDTLTISSLVSNRTYPLQVSLSAGHSDDIIINLQHANDTTIKANDLAMISDCVNAQIFQITNNVNQSIDNSTTPHTARLAHGVTPHPDFHTPYHNLDSTIGYSFRAAQSMLFHGQIVSQTFTIEPHYDHDGSSTTAALPCLMRALNNDPWQCVATHVESLQLHYGEDLTVPADFHADRYVSAQAVDDWTKVVSVKVSLLVRSDQARNTQAVGFDLDDIRVDIEQIAPASNGLFYSYTPISSTITLRNRVY